MANPSWRGKNAMRSLSLGDHLTVRRHRAANDPIGRPSPGDKVIDVAADFLSHLLRRFNSKEQEKVR